jgi:arsenate reductase
MTEKNLLKVMFLCTANSCRSQMAEGIARYVGKGVIEPYSAGLFSFHVHTRAIEVMKEINIDISQQKSKGIDKKLLNTMDIIITLCGHAEHSCPTTPPGIKRIHWPINDPVGTVGSEQEIINAFRKTRDEIKEKIERFVHEIKVRGEIT